MIKTSVIIPVYNTEKYLDKCIQSVLIQTQKEIEIILVDDGSTDKSGEIIDDYAKTYENVIAIHQSNQKLGAARNAGFQIARGEYVYFLDSDDFIREDTLETCYEYVKRNELDFVSFDANVFWEDKNDEVEADKTRCDRSFKNLSSQVMSGKEFWRQYYKTGGIIVSAVLLYINKKFIEQNGLLFEPGIFFEDNDWMVRVYAVAKRMSYMSEKLYYRQYRAGSIIKSSVTDFHCISIMKVVHKLLGIYMDAADKTEQQMCENILSAMCGRLNSMIKEIEFRVIEECVRKYLEELYVYRDMIKQLSLSCAEKVLYVPAFSLQKCFEGNGGNEGIITNAQRLLKVRDTYIREGYRLEEKIRIGIYGTGIICERIFEWYEKNTISVLADICFIVSDSDITEYRGYPVYKISELKQKQFEHIIVASTKYADEMMEGLKENGIESGSIFVTLSLREEY